MASITDPAAIATVTLSTAKPATVQADALVLGVRTDDDLDVFAESLGAVGFTGAKDQVATIPAGSVAKVRVLVAVGLPDEPSAEDLRRAAAVGLRAAASARATTVAIDLHPAGVDDTTAVVEGATLGSYRFDRYKASAPALLNAKKGDDVVSPDDGQADAPEPQRVDSIVVLSAFARQTVAIDLADEARTVVREVNRARDWVNTGPGDLRPPVFADEIAAAAPAGVEVSIWDEKRLAKERCGGILAVGAGSQAPPRLVRLTYSPSDAQKHVALVGKGITFDSGGLSIKTGAGMQTMKMDMGGAAAVVAATFAIARLGLPIAVTTFACLAENMPSGSATRPGDVITMRSGSTVEVLNTDAEGRLVLGDGLTLATEREPDLIIDAATLTGAAVIALGDRTAGVLGNHEPLVERVLDAAGRAGESMWPLPIVEEMKGIVHSSSVADLRQISTKPAGGTLFAAAFLREFVGDTHWAHLDIAGPAFNDGGVRGYTPTGGTGVGVRTLVQLVRDLQDV